jgi:hypothetical protein
MPGSKTPPGRSAARILRCSTCCLPHRTTWSAPESW